MRHAGPGVAILIVMNFFYLLTAPFDEVGSSFTEIDLNGMLYFENNNNNTEWFFSLKSYALKWLLKSWQLTFDGV